MYNAYCKKGLNLLKLKDILKTDKKQMSEVIVIEFRSEFENEDLLNGYAEYNKGILRSLDGDSSFTLEDDFKEFEWDSVDVPNDSLIVWE